MTDTAREALVQQMVKQVEPVLRASAPISEAERRLAPQAMDALIDAGILRALVPPVYHGADLGAVYGIKLFEELAYIDSAAAWVAFISAAGAWLPIVLPPNLMLAVLVASLWDLTTLALWGFAFLVAWSVPRPRQLRRA